MGEPKTHADYIRHQGQLETEASSWRAHWLEISSYMSPRTSRFLYTDRNKGVKKNQNVINSSPLMDIRTLKSGMQSGITPQSRPWFRLTTPDPRLAAIKQVRLWLDLVEERIRYAFSKSNFYNSTHTLYGDLATYGTAPMYIEDDADTMIRCYVFPIGQYFLANSRRLEVDTCYRRYSMTVAQLVEQFGLKKCSAGVQDLYEAKNYEAWRDVLHVIEPNRDVKPGRLGYEGMAWKSCWMEIQQEGGTVGFLREGGFHEFPVCAPRWDVAGEDVYGFCPGMDALGDVKALQLYERRSAQAAEKIINPPMVGPMSLMNQRANMMPGDVTYVPENVSGQVFKPAVEVPPTVMQVAAEEKRQLEARISAVFFADLWLAMTQLEKGQLTATEVSERHDEKMVQLGPVTERLGSEFLRPAINRTFSILLRQGRIPPPPRVLQGVDLRVDFLGPLAQAQKALGTGNVEKLMSFVGNLVAVVPQAMDKVNVDAVVDEYADDLAIPAKLLRTDDEVAQIRAHRQQQQEAAQQQQAALNAAKGAQVLSQADMGGDNALTRLVGDSLPPGSVQPAGAPQ